MRWASVLIEDLEQLTDGTGEMIGVAAVQGTGIEEKGARQVPYSVLHQHRTRSCEGETLDSAALRPAPTPAGPEAPFLQCLL